MKRRGESEPVQWFALMGGAAAWSLHLMLIYLISEWGCVQWPPTFQWLGITVTSWLLLAASVIAFALAAASTWVGCWRERELQKEEKEEDAPGEEDHAARFNHRLGYLMSGLFAFVIAFETIPTFYFLQGCGDR